MKVKNIYSVRGSIIFGNKLFVSENAKGAIDMYNSLVISRNNSFKEENRLASECDAIFKGVCYVD